MIPYGSAPTVELSCIDGLEVLVVAGPPKALLTLFCIIDIVILAFDETLDAPEFKAVVLILFPVINEELDPLVKLGIVFGAGLKLEDCSILIDIELILVDGLPRGIVLKEAYDLILEALTAATGVCLATFGLLLIDY